MWKKQNWPNEKWCFRAENFVEPWCDVCTFEICHRFNSSITIVVIIIIMIIMIIIIIIIYYNIIILYNIILSVKFWSDLKMWTLVSHSVELPKKDCLPLKLLQNMATLPSFKLEEEHFASTKNLGTCVVSRFSFSHILSHDENLLSIVIENPTKILKSCSKCNVLLVYCKHLVKSCKHLVGVNIIQVFYRWELTQQ